jgi:hypothetical protein
LSAQKALFNAPDEKETGTEKRKNRDNHPEARSKLRKALMKSRSRPADRPDWQCVLAKRFTFKRLDDPDYHGYVSLLHFDEVTGPLDVPFG